MMLNAQQKMAGVYVSHTHLFTFQVLHAHTFQPETEGIHQHFANKEHLEWRRAIMEVNFVLRLICVSGKQTGTMVQQFQDFKKCVESEIANDFFLTLEFSTGQWDIMTQNFTERECLYHLLQCVARDLSIEDAIQCGTGIVGLGMNVLDRRVQFVMSLVGATIRVAHGQLEFQVLAPNSKELSLLPADEVDMAGWIHTLENSIKDAEEMLRNLVQTSSESSARGSPQEESVHTESRTPNLSSAQGLMLDNLSAEQSPIRDDFPESYKNHAKIVTLERLNTLLDDMVTSIYSLNYAFQQNAAPQERNGPVLESDSLNMIASNGNAILMNHIQKNDGNQKDKHKSEELLKDENIKARQPPIFKEEHMNSLVRGSSRGQAFTNALLPSQDWNVPVNHSIDQQSLNYSGTNNNETPVSPVVIHVRVSQGRSPNLKETYSDVFTRTQVLARNGDTRIDIYTGQNNKAPTGQVSDDHLDEKKLSVANVLLNVHPHGQIETRQPAVSIFPAL